MTHTKFLCAASEIENFCVQVLDDRNDLHPRSVRTQEDEANTQNKALEALRMQRASLYALKLLY
jgi:hypothetical protein